jgi:hypothetical protein
MITGLFNLCFCPKFGASSLTSEHGGERIITSLLPGDEEGGLIAQKSRVEGSSIHTVALRFVRGPVHEERSAAASSGDTTRNTRCSFG